MGNAISWYWGETPQNDQIEEKKKKELSEEEKFMGYVKEIGYIIESDPPYKYCYTTPEEAFEIVKKDGIILCPDVPEYPSPFPIEFKPFFVPQHFDKSELKKKIRGLIIGQAVGDTVGLSTEFLNHQQALWFYKGKIDYDHYLRDSHRSSWMDLNWDCSDWSDDTDNTILLIDGIVANNGEVFVEDYAKRCRHWVEFGFSEIGDRGAMGVGRSFGRLVRTPGWVKNPFQFATEDWVNTKKQRASNGCVMKIAVLGIPSFWDFDKVKMNAMNICKTTHVDPRCISSCVVIVSLISQILKGMNDIESIISNALEEGRKCLSEEEHLKDFDHYSHASNLEEMDLCNCIGYVFKPMGCALWGLRQIGQNKTFEEIITEITLEAGDADTNSAVSGAVIGCFVGEESIPERWKKLRHYNFLNERIERLLKLYQI